MKYDLLCLPGTSPPGCGETSVSPDLGADHERGDRIRIRCSRCGRVGPCEVRGRLEGLA